MTRRLIPLAAGLACALAIAPGAALAAATSPAVAIDSHGDQHVFYVGSGGQIWQWVWTGSSWIDQQLEQAPAPPPPVQQTPVPTPIPAPSKPRSIHGQLVLFWRYDRARSWVARGHAKRLPRSVRITVRCRGRHCPRLPAALRMRTHRRLSVRQIVRILEGMRFHAGDKLYFTVTAAGRHPQRTVVRIRDGKKPVVVAG